MQRERRRKIEISLYKGYTLWIQAMLDVFIHCVILLCDRFTCIQSFRLITKAAGKNFFTEFLP